MTKLIITYACPSCETSYKNQRDATACSKKCTTTEKRRKNKELFQKYFPIFHQKDTMYEKFCVDCGTKIFEWEREYDGIDRPERGRLVYTYSDGTIRFGEKSYETILDGLRCGYCARNLRDWLLKVKLADRKRGKK